MANSSSNNQIDLDNVLRNIEAKSILSVIGHQLTDPQSIVGGHLEKFSVEWSFQPQVDPTQLLLDAEHRELSRLFVAIAETPHPFDRWLSSFVENGHRAWMHPHDYGDLIHLGGLTNLPMAQRILTDGRVWVGTLVLHEGSRVIYQRQLHIIERFGQPFIQMTVSIESPKTVAIVAL